MRNLEGYVEKESLRKEKLRLGAGLVGWTIARFPVFSDHLEIDDKPAAAVARLKVRVGVDIRVASDQVGELPLKLLASNGLMTLVHNLAASNESINQGASCIADDI